MAGEAAAGDRRLAGPPGPSRLAGNRRGARFPDRRFRQLARQSLVRRFPHQGRICSPRAARAACSPQGYRRPPPDRLDLCRDRLHLRCDRLDVRHSRLDRESPRFLRRRPCRPPRHDARPLRACLEQCEDVPQRPAGRLRLGGLFRNRLHRAALWNARALEPGHQSADRRGDAAPDARRLARARQHDHQCLAHLGAGQHALQPDQEHRDAGLVPRQQTLPFRCAGRRVGHLLYDRRRGDHDRQCQGIQDADGRHERQPGPAAALRGCHQERCLSRRRPGAVQAAAQEFQMAGRRASRLAGSHYPAENPADGTGPVRGHAPSALSRDQQVLRQLSFRSLREDRCPEESRI